MSTLRIARLVAAKDLRIECRARGISPAGGREQLLQRVRDEAHRFAIEFQRDLRRRVGMTSILEEIPGIGPGKRRSLHLRIRIGVNQLQQSVRVVELFDCLYPHFGILVLPFGRSKCFEHGHGSGSGLYS